MQDGLVVADGARFGGVYHHPPNPVIGTGMPNLDKLILCPACYYDLGVPPVAPENGKWRPPSLLLEVTSGQPGNRQWRLSLFGEGKSWASEGFAANAVRWVYRMCGDG